MISEQSCASFMNTNLQNILITHMLGEVEA